MPAAPGLSKRYLISLITVSALLVLVFFTSFRSNAHSPPNSNSKFAAAYIKDVSVDQGTLGGATIMPKLGNETAKAELGRSAWHLFHTIMARFPDKPSEDERSALQSYIHLFVRLYPCGECAEHFRQIVSKYPPQVSSRSAAAAWACHVHNEVNKSLMKEIFDCSNIGDFYDCGCAEDEKDAMGSTAVKMEQVRGLEKPEMSAAAKER